MRRWGIVPFLFPSFTFSLFHFVKIPSWDWRDSCQSSCLWCPGSAYLLIPHHLPASQGLLVIAWTPAWSIREGSKSWALQAAHDAQSADFSPGFQVMLLLLSFLARVRLKMGDPTALLPLWSQRDTDLTVNNGKELDFLCYAAHWMRFPTSVEVTTSFMRFDCQQDVMNPRC